jgi:cytochrome c1
LLLWVKEPDAFKPGCLMPAMQFDEQDTNAVVAYLMSLH